MEMQEYYRRGDVGITAKVGDVATTSPKTTHRTNLRR